MGIKRIMFNALLALALALPLAALEGRMDFGKRDYFAPEQARIQAAPPPGISEPAPGLVDLVGRKVARRFSPKKIEKRFESHIKQVARVHGVSPALVKAVIKAESGFNPHAVSSVGAVGLMQVMPETARRVGVQDPSDPHLNILAGVKYLKTLLDMFEGDEVLAVAAYNSGPGKVRQYGGIPPYRQTRAFVDRVMKYYRLYLES